MIASYEDLGVSSYLVESSQVPVMFCCLDITLSEVQAGEVKGEAVEPLGLGEQRPVLDVARVDGDLLEDEGQHSLAGGQEQVVSGQILAHDGERRLRVSFGVIELACKVLIQWKSLPQNPQPELYSLTYVA